MDKTPLLREALARALWATFYEEESGPWFDAGAADQDWLLRDADAILRALANDPEVESSCWTAVMYARRNIASLAATLFGEPDDRR